MTEPMLYTVKAFCAAHAMGITHFYKLVKEGKIATVTTEGRRLVPVESARSYRESLGFPVHKSVHKRDANSNEEERRLAKVAVKKPPLRQWRNEGKRRTANGG